MYANIPGYSPRVAKRWKSARVITCVAEVSVVRQGKSGAASKSELRAG